MKELHRSLPAKVGAIFLTVICGVFSVLSVLGIILSWEAGFYQGASDYLTSRPVTEMALGWLRPVATDLNQAQNDGTLESCLNSLPAQWENSNLQFSVWKNGILLGSSLSGSAGKDETAVTDPLAGEKTAICTSQGWRGSICWDFLRRWSFSSAPPGGGKGPIIPSSTILTACHWMSGCAPH